MTRANSETQVEGDGAPVEMRRALPAVHRVVAALGEVDVPRAVVVSVVREYLNELRSRAAEARALAEEEVVAEVRGALGKIAGGRIRPVINATGVVIHTNFGRSPLGESAVRAMVDAAENYTNLEYDLAAGKRGGRGAYLERSVALLCGAESATVVNNCAAALVLMVRHFAARPPRTEVVISRGELVQIGGGFRVPEILEASGARLREVGTTNQTTADDYRRAIDERTAMVLKVHRSNFFMEGFVASPTTDVLAGLCRERRVPMIEDLGSGATFDTAALGGNEHEPTPGEALAAGADLVCFSGDKLLGGPQAGIIAGGAAHVAALRREPLFRALRCDKLILAALEATVDQLLSERGGELPIRVMMSASVGSLRARGERIVGVLREAGVEASVGQGRAQVGGGSLPRTALDSVTIDIDGADPQRFAERLRAGEPPVVGYVAGDRLKLDLRTVFERQDEALIAAVLGAATA